MADTTPDLTLNAIPLVLDEEEVCFVLGFSPDARPGLEVHGAEYRRGSDRVMIDWRLGPIHARAMVIQSEGSSYLMASAGPILNDWWPLLQRAGEDRARPLLSAGVAGAAQVFRTEDLSINVSVVPAAPPAFPLTTAVMGLAKTDEISDSVLLAAHLYSLGVIKAALKVLLEYRTLVPSVPNLEVDVDGGRLPLDSVLETVPQAAAAIAWNHSPA
jgi:hypothetical protein